MEIEALNRLPREWWDGFAPPTLFQTYGYLAAYAKHFCPEPLLVRVKSGGNPLGLFPFERQGDRLILLGMNKVLGKEEVTDYGDILAVPADNQTYADIWRAVRDYAYGIGIRQIDLDYVRQDSRLYGYFASQGAQPSQAEVAPFIPLPPTWDSYLETLERTDRKELKRKMKRIENVEHSFEIHDVKEERAFNDFIRLHRLSDRAKEKFMSPAMEAFFRDLAQADFSPFSARIALLGIEGKTAAAIFYFEDKKAAYLYNSGFDPAFGYYSAGLMVHAYLVKHNIAAGYKTHDFLRGSERYKHDLGAKDMPLFRIEGTL